MQYNVFVVDDEPMIRLGLISTIDWTAEKLTLLGEAGNGEAALKKLQAQQEQVDILITDIKMPVMDGLELIRHVKQLNPDVQVILISSYSDFEYAREAVKLGVVVDYLLKPTLEPENLINLLRACRTRLEQRSLQQQSERFIHEQAERSKLHTLELELKDRLNGDRERPLTWTPAWLNRPLQAAVWQLDELTEPENKTALDHLVKIEHAMRELTRAVDESIALLMGNSEFILLIADRGGSGAMLMEQMHKRMLQELGISFTVGISPVFHHLSSLNDAYQWAEEACEQAFYAGRGRCYSGVITHSDTGSCKGQETEQVLAASFSQWSEQFSEAFANGDQQRSQLALSEIGDLWRSRQLTRSFILSQGKSLLTMMWSRNYKLKSEHMMLEIMDKLRHIERIGTLSELLQVIHHEYERQWTLEQVDMLSDDSSSAHMIQLALSYIQEHYRKELSLQKVADYVHMSKNYFSEQFKRRTGLNYIDFVIRLRIHYAKQLLSATNLRVQEVGEQSGFNSPKHFLKLFKREVGCTPAEYREHGQEHERQAIADQKQGVDGYDDGQTV